MLVNEKIQKYSDEILELLGEPALSTAERIVICELTKLMFVAEHVSKIVENQKGIVRA